MAGKGHDNGGRREGLGEPMRSGGPGVGGGGVSPALPSHFDLEQQCLLQMADNLSQRSTPPGAAQIHHWVQTLSSILAGDWINLLAASNRSATCYLV